MVVVASALLAGILAASGPAQASPSDPPARASHGVVIVETFKADGKTPVSRRTLAQRAVPRGDGGKSWSSGCRRVTVRNEEETLLGATAYWFNTWTSWCWDRSKHVVDRTKTGWFIDDVDWQFHWRGITNREFNFYDHGRNDGHPRSAFVHYRQGRFENCLVKYGCIGSLYPANTLRVYSNGTWAWSTDA